MANLRLKSYVLETVDNQLKDDNPKCTNETLKRLIALGYIEKEAKEMIASVLVEEIYKIMKNKREFNEEAYCSKLSMLSHYTGETIEENFEEETVQVPIRNENKIGRNDLCPCGSGKKYKKCCGK